MLCDALAILLLAHCFVRLGKRMRNGKERMLLALVTLLLKYYFIWLPLLVFRSSKACKIFLCYIILGCFVLYLWNLFCPLIFSIIFRIFLQNPLYKSTFPTIVKEASFQPPVFSLNKDVEKCGRYFKTIDPSICCKYSSQCTPEWKYIDELVSQEIVEAADQNHVVIQYLYVHNDKYVRPLLSQYFCISLPILWRASKDRVLVHELLSIFQSSDSSFYMFRWPLTANKQWLCVLSGQKGQ